MGYELIKPRIEVYEEGGQWLARRVHQDGREEPLEGVRASSKATAVGLASELSVGGESVMVIPQGDG